MQIRQLRAYNTHPFAQPTPLSGISFRLRFLYGPRLLAGGTLLDLDSVLRLDLVRFPDFLPFFLFDRCRLLLVLSRPDSFRRLLLRETFPLCR